MKPIPANSLEPQQLHEIRQSIWTEVGRLANEHPDCLTPDTARRVLFEMQVSGEQGPDGLKQTLGGILPNAEWERIARRPRAPGDDVEINPTGELLNKLASVHQRAQDLRQHGNLAFRLLGLQRRVKNLTPDERATLDSLKREKGRIEKELTLRKPELEIEKPSERKALIQAVEESQERLTPELSMLQTELGQIEKAKAKLLARKDPLGAVLGLSKSLKDLDRNALRQHIALDKRGREVADKLAILTPAASALAGLRGERSADKLEVVAFGGLAYVFVDNYLSADVYPAFTRTTRDALSGQRSRKRTLQVSLDTPMGGPKYFTDEGFGLSVTPPFCFINKDPFFGSAFGVKIPGLLFCSVMKRPDGSYAFELGGSPFKIAAKSLALAAALGAPVAAPAFLVAADKFPLQPYGGLIIQHPSIKPFAKPVIDRMEMVAETLGRLVGITGETATDPS